MVFTVTVPAPPTGYYWSAGLGTADVAIGLAAGNINYIVGAFDTTAGDSTSTASPYSHSFVLSNAMPMTVGFGGSGWLAGGGTYTSAYFIIVGIPADGTFVFTNGQAALTQTLDAPGAISPSSINCLAQSVTSSYFYLPILLQNDYTSITSSSWIGGVVVHGTIYDPPGSLNINNPGYLTFNVTANASCTSRTGTITVHYPGGDLVLTVTQSKSGGGSQATWTSAGTPDGITMNHGAPGLGETAAFVGTVLINPCDQLTGISGIPSWIHNVNHTDTADGSFPGYTDQAFVMDVDNNTTGLPRSVTLTLHYCSRDLYIYVTQALGSGPGDQPVVHQDIDVWRVGRHIVASTTSGNVIHLRSWFADSPLDYANQIYAGSDGAVPRVSISQYAGEISVMFRTGDGSGPAPYRWQRRSSWDYGETWLADTTSKAYLNDVKHADQCYLRSSGWRLELYRDSGGLLQCARFDPNNVPDPGNPYPSGGGGIGGAVIDDAAIGCVFIPCPYACAEVIFAVSGARKIYRSVEDGKSWVSMT